MIALEEMTKKEKIEYQKIKEEEVSMKPWEKRDFIIKEVVSPLLEQAGFIYEKFNWSKEIEDSYILIHMVSSKFDSFATGASFRFHISVSKKDEIKARIIDQWIYNQDNDLKQFAFLPNCGLLSPYFSADMYVIDGYKNYLPQDEPISNIIFQIRSDFQFCIIPELEKIKNYNDWKNLRKNKLLQYDLKEIRLLRYYRVACLYSHNEDNKKKLIEFQNQLELGKEDIVSQIDLVEKIEENSSFTNNNTKNYILETLED